jgi:hypothetical protein
MLVDLSMVSAVLLPDGWHTVKGGIELGPLEFAGHSAGPGATWRTHGGDVVFVQLSSILGLQYDRDDAPLRPAMASPKRQPSPDAGTRLPHDSGLS